MRTNLLILAAAAALSLATAGGSAATAAPDRAPPGSAQLRAALNGVVAAGAPGALVLVRNGDRTVRLAAGYGNLARRTPMRVTDRFRIGSETKMFVSTVDRNSSLARRNSRMARPSRFPSSGSLSGPKMSRARTMMTASS